MLDLICFWVSSSLEPHRCLLHHQVLNLVRNATKFVEHGFIRMRAAIVDDQVVLYVEDSGPGIPAEKRKNLFAKYQASLDLLSQGTGIGLSLSQKLMSSMKGDIWLDGSYDSGVAGCPGACFVIDLKSSPIDIDDVLSIDEMSDNSSSPEDIDIEKGLVHISKSLKQEMLQELPKGISCLFVDDEVSCHAANHISLQTSRGTVRLLLRVSHSINSS